ncbi:hypothetical protein COEREDRAFT_85332 [Coemansia reversa NRRL 1564]|uniref:Borealin N-terminal domain-containing protein n=1 Tax=Coemansia reversa (strain ATCC 12441 / NRRL 1564) TaxID=763665 RepID=A0A2G5BH63_COERN|nr:hypothetical protein COEREDRAFT_85332 [Coemansia reversa NRRL 1564]|eukprot:PIA18356.1 hypothetical protein COEREDRAFT_85332 [Coemansia reversa NRRL 1564]
MSTVTPKARPNGQSAEKLQTPEPASTRKRRTHNKQDIQQRNEEQRQAMIENFDLEIEDKIRSMMVQLEADKMDLQLKADCEIAQLPKCVREMPLRKFLQEYGGEVSVAARGTLNLEDQDDALFASLPETPLAIRVRRKAMASK